MRWPAGLLLAVLLGCQGAEGPSAAELGEACAGCHGDLAAEHAGSAHGEAAQSEVFVALRDRAQLAWKAASFCDGCHRPVGGTAGGLGCLTCHASVGNLGRGDGALIFEPEGPVQTGLPSGRAPHPGVQTGFLQSAELCGTCHDVDGPGPFQESAFSHWQASPAGARNQTCQACHLPRSPGGRTSHRPRGLMRGSDEEVRALLASAVALEPVGRQGGAVVVRVIGRGDGHPVPDGASFLRALWLEARVQGEPVGAPHWLSSRLFAGAREVVLPTEADRAEARGLEPGQARQVRFMVPEGVRVEVCLRFVRYRPDLVAALGLAPEVAGATLVVRCTSFDK